MKLLVIFTASVALFAQDPPPLTNGHLETRVFSGNLESQLHSDAPAWFGYRIKTIHQTGEIGCWKEGPAVRHLEGSDAAAVLFRVAHNKVEKVQLSSISCPLDAGGLKFVWLTGVTAEASLNELRQLIPGDGAIVAIAQHDDPRADTILDELAAANQPEKIREKVAFWLGTSRGASGARMLQQMLAQDPSEAVRDKVVFALSVSKQPEAMTTLVAAAKTDSSPHIRSQALFWLAQKAGKQAADTIVDAIQNDADAGVKKKALFALSQLPKDDGVPKLIEVAKNQRNPEVRKQAFFWLGQSGDPRALAFIEQVLTK